MPKIEIVSTVIFVICALLIWIVAAYSFVQMLRRTRQGHWSRLLFHYQWWNSNKVGNYITPAGIPHYRSLVRAIAAFLALILCGMIYVLLRIWMAGS